jgi:hypothetical protein
MGIGTEASINPELLVSAQARSVLCCHDASRSLLPNNGVRDQYKPGDSSAGLKFLEPKLPPDGANSKAMYIIILYSRGYTNALAAGD